MIATLDSLKPLAAATRAAREVMPTIGTQVGNGRLRVVSVTYRANGCSNGEHFLGSQRNLSQRRLAERLVELVSDNEFKRVVYAITTDAGAPADQQVAA